MHETTPRTVSRRQSYRGQRVEAQFRNGDKLIGWLNGWGPRVIRIRAASGVIERPVPDIARVIAF